jgi:hypothetical protein
MDQRTAVTTTYGYDNIYRELGDRRDVSLNTALAVTPLVFILKLIDPALRAKYYLHSINSAL